MKQLLSLTLLTLVMAFMSVSNLHSQESNKVLLIIRDGSGDLEFMLKKEAIIMKETIEKAGFKVEIATLSGEPISAGSVRLKPDLKISDVSVLDYEGFILPCLAVDDRVVPPQKEIVSLIKKVEGKPIAAQLGSIKILAKARRDEIQDGTEELAIALVKAIKTNTD